MITCFFYTHRCTEQPVTLTSPFASTKTGRPSCGVAEPCCSCEGNKGKRKKTVGWGSDLGRKRESSMLPCVPHSYLPSPWGKTCRIMDTSLHLQCSLIVCIVSVCFLAVNPLTQYTCISRFHGKIWQLQNNQSM